MTTKATTSPIASSYDPYNERQPRGRFLKPFPIKGTSSSFKVHPILRKRAEAYFRRVNPTGYRHDLGALDIFLDNFGVLIAEQFGPPVKRRKHQMTWRFLMRLWSVLHFNLLQKKPWWGSHYNSKGRKALAGEPRSLLRWLDFGDATRFPVRRFIRNPKPFSPLDNDLSGPHGNIWGEDLWQDRDREIFPDREHDPYLNPFDVLREYEDFDDIDWDPFADWDCDELFPEDWSPRDFSSNNVRAPGGEILPDDYPTKVDRLRILNPDQATPDLPLRVGNTLKEKRFFQRKTRDQGSHPTCVAHATCAALDILVERQFGRVGKHERFSPAWMHWALERDALGWDNGRRVDWIEKELWNELPCSEEAFPYSEGPRETKADWKKSHRVKSSADMTSRFGRVLCERIEPDKIAEMKKYLAGGWILVVSTSFTKSLAGPALHDYGLPLAPYIGEAREKVGHAWTLVGYDHVDGNTQWKYQGRFLALNSWGRGFPRNPVLGRGLASLPFGLFLTEGVSVMALKFAKI